MEAGTGRIEASVAAEGVALFTRTERDRHGSDPAVVADRLGIEVYAVGPGGAAVLVGGRGAYARVRGVEFIYVRDDLRGRELGEVIALFIARALLARWALDVDPWSWSHDFAYYLTRPRALDLRLMRAPSPDVEGVLARLAPPRVETVAASVA